MIATDDKVMAALEYMSADPHPLALAKKDLMDAENATKRTFAHCFIHAIGSSVEAKKAVAQIHKEYEEAQETEAAAFFIVKNEEARAKWADAIIEVWRTENANQRAAERIR
jgi:hypothetical protein